MQHVYFIIDEVALNSVDKGHDLGIIIDTKLTFVEHKNLMVGLLLFLIYINDVVDLFTDGSCIKCMVTMSNCISK